MFPSVKAAISTSTRVQYTPRAVTNQINWQEPNKKPSFLLQEKRERDQSYSTSPQGNSKAKEEERRQAKKGIDFFPTCSMLKLKKICNVPVLHYVRQLEPSTVSRWPQSHWTDLIGPPRSGTTNTHVGDATSKRPAPLFCQKPPSRPPMSGVPLIQ